MAKRYFCEGCNKGCRYGASHTCEHTCSDCMVSPPCKYAGPRIPCELCNRHFNSQTCFDNHKRKQAKRKSACELRKCCDTCGALIAQNTHECKKRFCTTCKEKKEAGHICFMRPLVTVPASSECVLYVFYDFETTQDTKRSDRQTSTYQIAFACNNSVLNVNISDIRQDCIQCGKRIH